LYEPAPAPSPPPPPRAKGRNTEIDIYTSKNETEIDIFKGYVYFSKIQTSSPYKTKANNTIEKNKASRVLHPPKPAPPATKTTSSSNVTVSA